MIALVVVMLFAAAPEHEFDDVRKFEFSQPDKTCECLQWKQVDGGYICVRPYCPVRR